jgi:hypothetical protein
MYGERYPNLFEAQVLRGPRVSRGDAFTSVGRDSLEQVINRMNVVQGGRFWGV